MSEPTRADGREIRLLRQAAEDAARMSRAAKIIGDLSDMVTRLQRERDAARALVADMQSRIAELTEDVRIAREAARPPAPWRSLGQFVRGEGGS